MPSTPRRPASGPPAKGEPLPTGATPIPDAEALLAREARLRLRSELLLEIVQAATSTLELDAILRVAVEKVGQAIQTDRCSVVLVEGPNPTSAIVVASLEVPDFQPIEIDLARYPEVQLLAASVVRRHQFVISV